MPKPSDKRKQELEDWVKKRLWPAWDKSLTPPSDSRRVFLNYILRDAPTDEFLEALEGHIKAQVRFWKLKKQADGRVIGACNLSTWYNAGRWDDEFIDESYTDVKQRIAGKKCSCGRDVIGEKYEVCHQCLKRQHPEIDLHHQTKVRVMQEKGLMPSSTESKKDYAMRCRDSLPREWRKMLSRST